MRRLLFALVLVALLSNRLACLQSHPEITMSAARAQARELLRQASALIKDIPDSEQQSLAANIAGRQVIAGDLPGALATVQQLSKPDEQAFAMGSVAWALVGSGNSPQALALIDGSKESMGKNISYSRIAQLLVEKNYLDEALRAAHLINDPDLLSDALVRLARIAAKAGDYSGARRALADALDVAEQAIKTNPGYAHLFNRVAAAQDDTGETPETFTALQRFSAIAHKTKQESGDTTVLQNLAVLQAHIGDVAAAMETIKQVPLDSADIGLTEVAQEHARRQSMDEAFAAVKQISKPWNKDGALRQIAMTRYLDGSLNDALEAINRIQQPSTRAEALADLVVQQAQRNDPGAYLSLQLWQVISTMNEGVAVTDTARGTMAVAYSFLGDFNSAQQILKAMTTPYVRNWPLQTLTSLLAYNGHTQEALNLAQQEAEALPRASSLYGAAYGILARIESEKSQSESH